MSEYLVVKADKQEVHLYRIMAKIAKAALEESENKTSFKDFSLNGIYGDGGIAILYTMVNVIMVYIKLLFAKSEVKQEKEKKLLYVFRNSLYEKTCNFIQ